MLQGDAGTLARLREAGIGDVGEVLARATCVRDLPDRSNHVLDAAGVRIFVKRTKRCRGRRPAEVEGILGAAAAGVPVPALLFWGRDPRHGDVVATSDAAPARPLDALLAGGALEGRLRVRVLRDLARAVAALHDARLHHRDLYLNHVLVNPASARPVVAILDWERHGRHVRRLGRWVVKDLAALASSAPEEDVGDGERTRFLAAYLALRGLRRRARVARLAQRVRRKAARIRRHVPRTPVGAAARPRGGDTCR